MRTCTCHFEPCHVTDVADTPHRDECQGHIDSGQAHGSSLGWSLGNLATTFFFVPAEPHSAPKRSALPTPRCSYRCVWSLGPSTACLEEWFFDHPRSYERNVWRGFPQARPTLHEGCTCGKITIRTFHAVHAQRDIQSDVVSSCRLSWTSVWTDHPNISSRSSQQRCRTGHFVVLHV